MKPSAILFFFVVAACAVGALLLLDNLERIQVWARNSNRQKNRQKSGRRFDNRHADQRSGAEIQTAQMTAPVTSSGAGVSDIGRQRAGVTVSAAPIMSHHTARNSAKARLMGQFQWGQWLSGVAGFIWRRPLPLLFFAGFVVIAVTFSGCVPDWGKSKDELRFERELAQAEAETQAAINARDAAIAQAAQDAALSRERIQQASQRGRDAIEAATPENEAPIDAELVAAWRFALDELCVQRADGSRADTCGPGAAPAM